MRYNTALCFILLTLVFSCSFDSKREKNQVVDDVFCMDSIKVLKIAEDTLISLYGSRIKKQKPFRLKLLNDSVWVISGTQDTTVLGGVAHIEIQRSNCEILQITHGK